MINNTRKTSKQLDSLTHLKFNSYDVQLISPLNFNSYEIQVVKKYKSHELTCI